MQKSSKTIDDSISSGMIFSCHVTGTLAEASLMTSTRNIKEVLGAKSTPPPFRHYTRPQYPGMNRVNYCSDTPVRSTHNVFFA